MTRARTLTWSGLIAGALLALGAGVVFRTPSAARLDFDPAELAGRETRMWQAYYEKQPERVALELVAVLREQFGLSYAVSTLAARDFADAARLFRDSHDGYEATVLPPLERAYDRIQRARRARWDARAVARAELAWWVARRTPRQWDAESVGKAIGQLYVQLYDIDPAAALRAGRLRAQAAEIRTAGSYGGTVDWPRVRTRLTESYRELQGAIQAQRRRS